MGGGAAYHRDPPSLERHGDCATARREVRILATTTPPVTERDVRDYIHGPDPGIAHLRTALVVTSEVIRAALGWLPERGLTQMVADAWAFNGHLADVR